jgi:hypothetical protein
MPQPTPPNVTPPKKPDSGNSKGGDPKGEVRGRRGNDKPDKP